MLPTTFCLRFAALDSTQALGNASRNLAAVQALDASCSKVDRDVVFVLIGPPNEALQLLLVGNGSPALCGHLARCSAPGGALDASCQLVAHELGLAPLENVSPPALREGWTRAVVRGVGREEQVVEMHTCTIGAPPLWIKSMRVRCTGSARACLWRRSARYARRALALRRPNMPLQVDTTQAMSFVPIGC